MVDRRPAAARWTIGAVLRTLQDDFPDVTISKIRFLEAEGLIKPERTPSGYRSFSDRDVERLRYVLEAQRDRFWPLKVIREALDSLDRGVDPQGGRSSASAGGRGGTARGGDGDVGTGEGSAADHRDPVAPPPSALLRRDAPARLNRREVMRATGLDAATFDALAGYGLLSPGRDGHFTESALPIARAAAALAAHGIEARHLRPFRTAADREIGLVQQVVAPRRGRDPERDDETLAELLHHCIALHTALVRAGLER